MFGRLGDVLSLDVRPFPAGEGLLVYFGCTADWHKTHFRLLALPLNYALELGFFALGGVCYWRQKRKLRDARIDDLFWLVAVGVSLTTCAFARSAVACNDLGWRGLLFAQFGLLLWSAPLADSILPGGRRGLDLRPWTRRLAIALLAVGLLSTADDLGMPRVGGHLVARDNGASIVLDYSDNVHQGRDSLQMRRAYDLPPQQVAQEASILRIDFLVLAVGDPVWKNAPLWDALAKPVYSDDSVRVYSVPAMLKGATNPSAGFRSS
jgi:hypothetical protein